MDNQWEQTGNLDFDLASEVVTAIINTPDEEFLRSLQSKDVDLQAEVYRCKKNTQATFARLGLPIPPELQDLPIPNNRVFEDEGPTQYLNRLIGISSASNEEFLAELLQREKTKKEANNSPLLPDNLLSEYK